MPRDSWHSLVMWSGALLVALAAHDASHALDDGLKTPLGQLALVAVPQWLALAVVMAVIIRGDRAHAAAAALLLGIAVTTGFAVAHLLPFSTDSYWDLRPSVVSWLLAWVPAALGLAVAALAWSRWLAAAPEYAGTAHPVEMPIEALGCAPEHDREEDPSDGTTDEQGERRRQIGHRPRDNSPDESAEERNGRWG